MIKMDILSDPICPWCFIGKTQLDHALETAGDHPFEIEWHPFQLNPDMPAEGMDRRQYLEAKFGGKENAVRVYAQIATAAAAQGLEIDFEAIKRTPNTLDAHRLIHWAGLEGRQTFVVDRLFRAYFCEGKDIGQTDVLVDVAAAAGLDPAMIAQLLKGDGDIDDIRARDANAREKGVTGVPCFIVGGQHAVPGAQPPELWLQVIRELTESAK